MAQAYGLSSLTALPLLMVEPSKACSQAYLTIQKNPKGNKNCERSQIFQAKPAFQCENH